MVVDTSAIVAVLNKEPLAERLVRCALDAQGVLMSEGTAVELGIVVRTRWGPDGDRLKTLLLDRLRIESVDVDARQARIAVEAYSRFGRGTGSPARLNFGDCFAYALAKARDLPLLFVGDDFLHTDLHPALR
jgi:ribonuclease VapC